MDRFVKIGITIVLDALGDKANKPKMKKAMLKVFATLWSIYGDDEAFQAVVRDESIMDRAR